MGPFITAMAAFGIFCLVMFAFLLICVVIYALDSWYGRRLARKKLAEDLAEYQARVGKMNDLALKLTYSNWCRCAKQALLGEEKLEILKKEMERRGFSMAGGRISLK